MTMSSNVARRRDRRSVKTASADRVMHLHRVAGDLITPIGVAPIPAAPVCVRTAEREQWDWVVLPVADDPLYQSGQLAIPRGIRRRLTLLDDRGVSFDMLLIAHEIPKGILAAGAVSTKAAAHAVASTPATPSSATKHLTTLVNGLATGASVVASTAVASAAALAALAPDPVLLGVLAANGKSTPKTPAAYFEIARW